MYLHIGIIPVKVKEKLLLLNSKSVALKLYRSMSTSETTLVFRKHITAA